MAETLKELGIGFRQRVFTPYMTLYALLSQVFADDGSCRRAVIEVATILSDLADLYRKRWQVELNLRSIKTVLVMDILRSTSEDMVVKEVWVHMLAYNLVRETMCAVAATKRCLPSEVSFRSMQQTMSAWRLVNAVRGKPLHQDEMIELLMSQSLVGQRPDRYEPRAIKRRQKSYRLLIHSRDVAKTMLHKKSKK